MAGWVYKTDDRKLEDEKGLDDVSLDLLDTLDVDVTPREDGSETDDGDGSRRDEHVLEGVVVGHDDGLVSGRADGVSDLDGQVAVDAGEVGFGFFRQIFHELLREDARPDGAGHGTADAATDAGKHALDGQDDGDLLVSGGRHDGNLLGDDGGAAGEGVEDLHEDDPAETGPGMAELNQQADGQDCHGHAKVQGDPLETTGASDGVADRNGEKAGSDAIDATDVARLPDICSQDHLQEGAEIGRPDVILDEQDGGENAGSDDRAVLEKVPWHVLDGGEILLPDDGRTDEDDADDDERDRQRVSPAVLLVRINAEGQEEERESGGEQDEADDVELPEVVDDGLDGGSAALLADDDSLLHRLALIVGEQEVEWQADDWGDDGEDTEAPSPTYPVEDALGERTGDPDGGDVG